MNANASPPKKKGIFARISDIPARMSLPARGAAVTAIFLVTLVTVVWTAFLFDSSHLPWRHGMTFQRIAIVIGTAMLLPWLVYEGLRLWLDEPRSQFADLKFAWNAGLRALKEHGLSLQTTPLFLVLGSPNGDQEQGLMHSAGRPLRLKGVPEGTAPLHWYADVDGIFLFLTEVSRTSALSTLMYQHSNPAAVSATSGPLANPKVVAGSPTTGPLGSLELELSSKAATELELSFQTVCQLIRSARRPLCPCNGILVLLPFSVFRLKGEIMENFEKAIKTDLLDLHESFQVRCPVMSLIVGMEYEAGFREMVRRIGVDRTRSQRFGMGFDVRAKATSVELSLLAAHVSGRFEDWVYELFREPGTLSRPGNRHLFSLLCQVRSLLQVRLANLLARSFGFDAAARSQETPFLFCGCYFAAVGDTSDRQAFVKGAIDKLVTEQEHVEWTPQTLRIDRRNTWVARSVFFVNGILFLTLIAMILDMRLGWSRRVFDASAS